GINQKWIYDPTNQYLRSAVDNSKCITVYKGLSAQQQPLSIYDCGGGGVGMQAAQKFPYNAQLQQWQVLGRCMDILRGVATSMSPADLPAGSVLAQQAAGTAP